MPEGVGEGKVRGDEGEKRREVEREGWVCRRRRGVVEVWVGQRRVLVGRTVGRSSEGRLVGAQTDDENDGTEAMVV